MESLDVLTELEQLYKSLKGDAQELTDENADELEHDKAYLSSSHALIRISDLIKDGKLITLCISLDDKIREKAKDTIQEFIKLNSSGIDEFFISLIQWLNYKEPNEIILYFSLVVWICNIHPDWVGNSSKGFLQVVETLLTFIESDEETKIS